jgi:hypothetical protein
MDEATAVTFAEDTLGEAYSDDDGEWAVLLELSNGQFFVVLDGVHVPFCIAPIIRHPIGPKQARDIDDGERR